MKKADIKTGFLCNNNCLFCVQGHKKKFGDKSTTELKSILDKAAKDCEIAVFTGGEPTIRQDIFELVRYAKKLGFKTIQIQSNGRMFAYSDFCQKMIAAGANEFALALHGHTAELHNYLTQAESFQQTVSGIRNLKELNQVVITNTVITKSNYRHLPEITKLLLSLEVDQVQLAFVHAIGAAEKNFDKVVSRMSLVVPYIEKSLVIGEKMKKNVMIEGIPVCFLEKYKECISEYVIPDTKIFDLGITIDDYKKSRLVEGKSRGLACKKCKYFNQCEGSWREYPEKFGWDEFKAIKK